MAKAHFVFAHGAAYYFFSRLPALLKDKEIIYKEIVGRNRKKWVWANGAETRGGYARWLFLVT